MTTLLVVLAVLSFVPWAVLMRGMPCEVCSRPWAVFTSRGRVGSIATCWRCHRAHRRRQQLRGQR